MITKTSQFNVDETLDRLESILNEKGIKPLARVNHSAAAKSVDMDLPPTQVLIFGNPKLGTPLIQANRLAGLDLPMRVLAWEDETGTTQLAYHEPQELAQGLGIESVDESIAQMTKALNLLTDHATTNSPG